MSRAWWMARATIRHRPGRTLLTALVVVIGVSLMVALQVVVTSTDTALAPLYAGPEGGADWRVAPQGASDQPLHPELLAALRSQPEVAWAAPRAVTTVKAELAGELKTGFLWAVDPETELEAGLMQLVQGDLPAPGAPGVAVRADLAGGAGLSLGDRLAFHLPDGRRVELPLVGLLSRQGVAGSGGFVGLVIHLDRAPSLGLPAGPQRLLIGLRPEARPNWTTAGEGLVRRYGAFLEPPDRGYEGRTGAFNLMLIFSGLGPLLCLFLIRNSFAISLQERRQELALWRTMGATRRQILAMLLTEGALLGILGGLAGLIPGLAAARWVLRYIASFASISPTQSIAAIPLSMPPWLPWAAMLVGAGVAVVSALRPALQGLRSGAATLDRAPGSRLSTGLWAALALLASAGSLWLTGRPASLLLGALLFAALLALLPALLHWLSWRFPTLVSPSGSTVSLAGWRLRETRHRAAGGARALALATGLLVGFGALTQTTWQATREAVLADRSDVIVRGPSGDFRSILGVASVTTLYQFDLIVGREMLEARAFDPSQGLPVALQSGDPSAFQASGTVLVGSNLARTQGLQVGSTLEILRPRRQGEDPRTVAPQRLTVAGIVPEDWDGPTTLWLSLDEARQGGYNPIPVAASVRLTAGADPNQVAEAIRQTAPQGRVETREHRLAAARLFHQEKLGLFEAILYLLAGYGALGVVQASLLAVLEQRRDLALLRAAGATPRQTTLYVLAQTALPGLAGGAVGAIGGTLFGHHLVQVFAAWQGAALSGGLGQWYLPVALSLGLSLLAALPATLRAARLPAAAALRQE